MEYREQAKKLIHIDKLPETGKERLSGITAELMKHDYVIDVHSHLFDIKCINKSYYIIRSIKDFLGLKSNGTGNIEFDEEDAYKNVSTNEEGWEDELIAELTGDPDIRFVNKTEPSKGLVDVAKALRFLSFKNMVDVYDHYIEEYSLAEILGKQKTHVISTALTMDLETGWNVKITKSMYSQIGELKELSKSKPILPFLYCDPRRANKTGTKKNLYSLFNYAFCEEPFFFGIKIYPALGYDPDDFRLWPIYEICEKYSIPVLTHCGGESVSTDKRKLGIFEGTHKKMVTAKNRKLVAYELNNPKRWEPVLQQFPKLKLDFGHFGGYETWDSSSPVSIEKDPQQRKECIINLMNTYPNVYADFAYNFIEGNLANNFINVLIYKDIVRQRALFGTDYWMVTPKGNLRVDQTDFVKRIERLEKASPDNLNLLNTLILDNPKKFLFD